MGKRHLTPAEIIRQCKIVARENRTAHCTPWTVMSIICPYTLLKCEGYKGQRIAKIVARIEEYEAQWKDDKVDLEELKKRAADKVGSESEVLKYKVYTEADITAKKGSYDYWLTSRQIDSWSAMNEQATRYLIFFYNALIDVEHFGKQRILRVDEYMNNLMQEYVFSKAVMATWRKELFEEACIDVEMPLDPETLKRGSAMTGF